MRKINEVPNIEQLEAELKRETYKVRYRNTLRSTVYLLVVVAAVATLAATIFLPVLRIYGSSMTPTVSEGEIVVTFRNSSFKTGDILAVYYGNKLMVKRCIAGPGQWVSIDLEGNVSVDGTLLDEPYITDKALGDCDLVFPYQVPESCYFLMGDHRSTSEDSRNSLIGCFNEENIVGRIFLRVWPLNRFGGVR